MPVLSMSRRGHPPPAIPCLSPPGSVDNTGATNASASLQSWLNSVPDGSQICFSGSYRIDQQINLVNRNNLTMTGGYFFTNDPTGDGSTLGAPSGAARTRSHWEFKGSTNIVVTSMTVRGPNSGGGYVAALESQMAFNLLGCTRVEIYNCTVSDIYGDWFYMSIHPVSGAWCDTVSLHNNTLSANGRQGFSLVAARHISIRSNSCATMARAFVDLEPNGAALFGCDDVLIDSNAVGTHGLTFVASGGIGPVDNITISNNTVTGGNLWMLVYGSGGSRANWVINNNTSNVSYNSGSSVVMELEMMTNVTVTNNTQDVTGGSPMGLAYYNQCIGVIQQGNTVNNATYSIVNNASRYIRNCGNRLTSAGAFNDPVVCVTNFGLATQYSGLTGWFDAYQDAATYADLAAVASVTDYSGNARHMVSSGTARPTMRYSIAGKAIKGFQFDGVDDYAGNTIAVSQFITNSAYTIFVVFEATTIGSGIDNDAVWSETSPTSGLYMHSTPDAYMYNYDGTSDSLTKSITLGKRTLLMMRHEAGNLYMSKDGGAETSTASGNTTTLAGLVRLGVNYLGNEFANILIHEIEFYNVALTTAQITDRNSRLMIDWKVAYVYGASDTFTRANGAIGVEESGSKAWQISANTAWSVVGNLAKLTTADSLSGTNKAWIDCGLSDCTVSVDIDAALGGSLLFRFLDYRNYNMLIVDAGTGTVHLYKTISESFTEIHNTTGLAAAGIRQLKVVLSGSTVQSYYDGALIWTDTLTNCQTAFNHGLFQFASSAPACTWDNFLVVP